MVSSDHYNPPAGLSRSVADLGQWHRSAAQPQGGPARISVSHSTQCPHYICELIALPERPVLAHLESPAMSAFPPLSGGMCCKTIFTTKLSNIDLRTSAGAQHRFNVVFGRSDSIIALAAQRRVLHHIQGHNGHGITPDLSRSDL
jgi:hypothetical protein